MAALIGDGLIKNLRVTRRQCLVQCLGAKGGFKSVCIGKSGLRVIKFAQCGRFCRQLPAGIKDHGQCPGHHNAPHHAPHHTRPPIVWGISARP
ncbi:MAG: hypothetical protein CMO04_07890 [Thalassospira sp.]|nr:hypothetical protein [Thalassospira sp.]